MANVLFKSCTYDVYSKLPQKDANALYFTSDTNQLFKGEDEFTKSLKFVSSLPETGDFGTIYVENKILHAWDGKKFVALTLEYVTAISGSPTDTKIPTEKAVSDAIKNSGAFVNVEYDTSGQDNNKLKFTKLDGSTKEIDIAKDNFLSSAKLNTDTKELELTMSNGDVVRIPVADLMISEIDTDKVVTAKDITFKGQTIGSYADGTTITKGTKLSEVLQKLAAKQIPPSYKAPTSTLSPSNQSVEAGSSVTPTITSAYTKNDGGNVTSYKVTRTLSGKATEIKTGTTVENVVDTAQIVPDGANLSYKAEIGYAAGTVKNDNLGNPYPSTSIKAGTLTKTMTYTGQRKRFHSIGTGKVPALNSDAIRGMTSVLNPTAGQSFDLTVSVGKQHVVVAIPEARTIKSITYVEANDPNMLGNFKKQTVQVADARGGSNGLMNYNVYTYEMAGAAQAVMTFRVVLQ